MCVYRSAYTEHAGVWMIGRRGSRSFCSSPAQAGMEVREAGGYEGGRMNGNTRSSDEDGRVDVTYR
jgi:hypothetical protein